MQSFVAECRRVENLALPYARPARWGRAAVRERLTSWAARASRPNASPRDLFLQGVSFSCSCEKLKTTNRETSLVAIFTIMFGSCQSNKYIFDTSQHLFKEV